MSCEEAVRVSRAVDLDLQTPSSETSVGSLLWLSSSPGSDGVGMFASSKNATRRGRVPVFERGKRN